MPFTKGNYLYLFTCAVSQALYLENYIVTDLSIECFLLAFRRFAGRRSVPKLLLSNNGYTYLAAAEELRDLFSSAELSDALARRGIQWQFIPKRSPWWVLGVIN